MIALLVAFLLTSPAPACAWWSRAEQRCRDADVEYLGPWDPRPLDWSVYNYVSKPPEFGAYPTEKPVAP